MLIPIILTVGCITFLCIGIVLASWAGIDISEDGPDIKNIVTLLVGIGVIAFGFFSMIKAGEYYHEKESLKPEITTSISP